jgi:hypothetical protein
MIKQLIGYMLLSSVVLATAGPERAAVAPPPPMGWNSFDAWDCRITERQFKTNVDFIKADDMIFRNYHAGEVEVIRWAMDRCGRPMVLK